MIMDDGEPTQLSSTTRVVIKVEDVNDNVPEFDQKTYNVEIPSNAKINQKVFQVSLRRSFYINFHSYFHLNTSHSQNKAAPYAIRKKTLNDL